MRPGLAFLAVLAVVGGASAAEISPAERLVFEGDHLGGLRPPAVLSYSLAETGVDAVEPGETLELQLKAKADGGCCAVEPRDVDGASFGYMPALEEARSNPVILYFLERDVRRMQARTGGQSSYFRRLIRLALADHATVSDTTVRYGGREVAAREVRVIPYAEDPRRSLFEPLADTAYSFVLAPEAPGGVYQIKVTAPASATVLTLAEAAAATPVQER